MGLHDEKISLVFIFSGDLRSYGFREDLYTEARKMGSRLIQRSNYGGRWAESDADFNLTANRRF